MIDFKTALEAAQKLVDQELHSLIDPLDGENTRLVESIEYSTFNGGKRLRPFFCLAFAEILGVQQKQAVRVAAAIELLHSYSLIHDDLPPMDNSDIRRGKPSCHIRFDEATAILAGDAMLVFVFEVLSNPKTHPDPEIRCELMRLLAEAGGPQGMALGQIMDIEWAGKSIDLEQLKRLQKLKTGMLIEFSCLAPAILRTISEDTYRAIQAYGEKVGLLFQIVDDILDSEGKLEILGKPPKQDKEKTTFVSLLGIEKAHTFAEDLCRSALLDIEVLGKQAVVLKQATQFILNRQI